MWRVDDVEMALRHRHVDRLADHAAGMVQVRRHVGELHEVLQILERAVAPLVLEVAHEGRAVGRREARCCGRRSTTLRSGLRACCVYCAGAVARISISRPRGDVHALAVDLGAGLAPERRARCASRKSMPISSRMVIDASWMISRPGVVEQLVERDLAGDVPLLDDRCGGTLGAAAGLAAPAVSRDLGHFLLPARLPTSVGPPWPAGQSRGATGSPPRGDAGRHRRTMRQPGNRGDM